MAGYLEHIRALFAKRAEAQAALADADAQLKNALTPRAEALCALVGELAETRLGRLSLEDDDVVCHVLDWEQDGPVGHWIENSELTGRFPLAWFALSLEDAKAALRQRIQAERRAKKAQEAQDRAAVEQYERQLLAVLQAKYGSPP